MIQIEQERAGDAIAELRAAGKRLGDPDLSAAIRRVLWQATRDAQRSAAAEAQATRSAAQVDVLTRQRDLISRQRDEAVAQVRQLQRSGPDARLQRLGAEFQRAVTERSQAVRERDQARAEVTKLKTALKAKPAAVPEPSKAPKPKQPAFFDTIPPVQPSTDEVAMMAERALVVAEAGRLTDLGKRRTPAEHTRLVTLQAKLAEFAPRVKAFKALRLAKLMALQSDALAQEAMNAARLAAS